MMAVVAVVAAVALGSFLGQIIPRRLVNRKDRQ